MLMTCSGGLHRQLIWLLFSFSIIIAYGNSRIKIPFYFLSAISKLHLNIFYRTFVSSVSILPNLVTPSSCNSQKKKIGFLLNYTSLMICINRICSIFYKLKMNMSINHILIIFRMFVVPLFYHPLMMTFDSIEF